MYCIHCMSEHVHAHSYTLQRDRSLATNVLLRNSKALSRFERVFPRIVNTQLYWLTESQRAKL